MKQYIDKNPEEIMLYFAVQKVYFPAQRKFFTDLRQENIIFQYFL